MAVRLYLTQFEVKNPATGATSNYEAWHPSFYYTLCFCNRRIFEICVPFLCFFNDSLIFSSLYPLPHKTEISAYSPQLKITSFILSSFLIHLLRIFLPIGPRHVWICCLKISFLLYLLNALLHTGQRISLLCTWFPLSVVVYSHSEHL